MKFTVRTWILTLLAASLGASTAAASPGDEVNDISGIEITETESQTVIRIVGDDHPTFSVYRLRTPLRLFVDISDSALAASLPNQSVNNGVVSEVGAVTYSDELTDVTRVVIGFDVDATYDVVAEDGDLVITVDGSMRTSTEAAVAVVPPDVMDELATARERSSALQAALEDAEARAATAEAEVLSTQLDLQRAEESRLAALAGVDLAAEATERLRRESQARLDALSADLQARDTRVAELSQEIAALRASGADASVVNELSGARDAAQAEVDRMQIAVRQLQEERDAALAQVASAQDSERLIAAQQRQLDELASANRAAEARLNELGQQWAATQGPPSIADVRFEQDGNVDRVIIEIAAGAEFMSQPWEDGLAAIVFDDASLPDSLRRTLDTQAFNGPVRFVSSYTDTDGMVRVVAELQGAVSEIVRQESDRIVWEFTRAADELPAVAEGTYTASPEPAALAMGVHTAQDGNWGGSTEYRSESPFQQPPRMSNKRITIDLRDADIANVLRLLADEGNINIVASDDVDGSVTLRLRSVPLDEALSIILQSKGYGWMQEGSVLRVAPLETFEAEYDAYLERLATEAGLEPLQVRMIPVNYATAMQLTMVVSSVLSSRGTVTADSRSNMLIVTDVIGNLDAAEQIVAQLDTQTPQILIEARIVETNDQFRRQLGIQWGGDFVADQSRGNSTGLLFPSTIGIAGGAADGQTPIAGTSSQPNFAVNLPAPAGTGSGGAIGMTLGSLSGAFNLNLRLSAAETQGSAKIISAPRIMTLHNQAASITSGVSIPVSVVSAAGAQTVFFDAALTLNVTPRVTPDGNIFLDVNVTKNEPDFENTGSRGDPSIVRREARTQLLVRDGDTTVIGGIFQRNTGFSTDRVPFLGSLPIIGPLFRSSSRTDVRNELLVFITPRIVNRDMSIDVVGTGGDIMQPDEEE
jgi:type IV pilus assembly protein PilQ